jgi:hypothetical protein
MVASLAARRRGALCVALVYELVASAHAPRSGALLRTSDDLALRRCVPPLQELRVVRFAHRTREVVQFRFCAVGVVQFAQKGPLPGAVIVTASAVIS